MGKSKWARMAPALVLKYVRLRWSWLIVLGSDLREREP